MVFTPEKKSDPKAAKMPNSKVIFMQTKGVYKEEGFPILDKPFLTEKAIPPLPEGEGWVEGSRKQR